MPTILTEETKAGKLVLKLTFEFSDKWQVCKYDEQKFYNRIKGQGLKGVDFLAMSEKSVLLIEAKYVIADDKKSTLRFVKDADNEKIKEIKIKLTEEENKAVTIEPIRPYLVDEMVKKVKDTLLGLFASYRNQNAELLPYSQAVFMCSDKPILVLLFLERNEELNQEQFFKPQATSLKLAIEQKLSFLGNIKVAVINSKTLPLELGINILENSITSLS